MLLTVFIQPQLGGIVDQCALGRLTDSSAFSGVKFCVGAERHGVSQQTFVLAYMIDNRHFVLRQGTGLVRADDLRTTQRFDCRQFTDDRILFGHVGHADGQHNRHNGGQSLRNGGYRQRNGDHEGVQDCFRQVSAAVRDQRSCEVDREDDHADAHYQVGQDAAELTQLDLQRRFAFLGLRQCGGNLAHFGTHAGCRNDSLSATVHDGGTHENHIDAVAERYIPAFSRRQTLGSFDNRHRLTRQGGFLDLHAGALQETCVGGNCIARFQNDDIADDEIFTVYGHLLSVAQYL